MKEVRTLEPNLRLKLERALLFEQETNGIATYKGSIRDVELDTDAIIDVVIATIDL